MTTRSFHLGINQLLFGLTLAACAVATSARADDERRPPPRDDDDYEEHHSRKDDDKSKTHIAVDFDFGAALDAPGTKNGGGGALRLGQEFDLLLVSLTPEIAAVTTRLVETTKRGSIRASLAGGWRLARSSSLPFTATSASLTPTG